MPRSKGDTNTNSGKTVNEMQAPKYKPGFDRFDQNRLQDAKELLIKVLEYNYGAPGMRQKVSRLDTIIKKLEILQNMD